MHRKILLYTVWRTRRYLYLLFGIELSISGFKICRRSHLSTSPFMKVLIVPLISSERLRYIFLAKYEPEETGSEVVAAIVKRWAKRRSSRAWDTICSCFKSMHRIFNVVYSLRTKHGYNTIRLRLQNSPNSVLLANHHHHHQSPHRSVHCWT